MNVVATSHNEVAEACDARARLFRSYKNRDPVKCGLRSLQFNEQGLTPLNTQTCYGPIRPNVDPSRTSKPLNPVVVVFSDGTEDGDPSGELFGKWCWSDLNRYRGSTSPQHFVHLGAPRTSRSSSSHLVVPKNFSASRVRQVGNISSSRMRASFSTIATSPAY